MESGTGDARKLVEESVLGRLEHCSELARKAVLGNRFLGKRARNLGLGKKLLGKL
jgi:hypothetical protein